MPNSTRTRFDVGLLTSEEVNEISLLIKHESAMYDFSAERKKSNPAISGMYRELADLGLVSLNIDGACIEVLPMGHWAVEKYNQEARDKLKAQKLVWKHDFAVAGFSAFLGIIGTLLGVWVGALIG